MKRVDVDIQDGFMSRKGWMGRFVTVYWHAYGGRKEETERFHTHPWKLAVSVVVRGKYDEVANGSVRRRKALSIRCYGKGDMHRIQWAEPGTKSIFLGLLRLRIPDRHYTETTKYGAAHYSELRSVSAADIPSP